MATTNCQIRRTDYFRSVLLFCVCPAWAVTWRRKSAGGLAVGTTSRRDTGTLDRAKTRGREFCPNMSISTKQRESANHGRFFFFVHFFPATELSAPTAHPAHPAHHFAPPLSIATTHKFFIG